jgi:hypothetical protein
MATVSNLIRDVETTVQTLTSLQSDIQRNLQTVGTSAAANLPIEHEIRDMNAKASAIDRVFEEEEAAIQAMGGKTRMQTLQEFVLLSFFVSYSIFTLTLVLHAYVRGDTSTAVKILGGMAVILLLVCCFLLKLA